MPTPARRVAALALVGAAWPALAATPPDLDPLREDLDADGRVTLADLGVFAANFGRSDDDRCLDPLHAGVAPSDGDADLDGDVDLEDFARLAARFGDTAPPIPPVPGVALAVTPEGAALRVVDEFDGADAVIIDPNPGDALWRPRAGDGPAHAQPAVDVRPRPDGFDLVYTYANNSGEPRRLGEIVLPGLRLGDAIAKREFSSDSRERIRELAGNRFRDRFHQYPGVKYAAATTLRAGVLAADGSTREYVVGVSLLYPVVEYRHAVQFSTHAEGGVWQFEASLNNPGRSNNVQRPENPDGYLRPGETRRYTLCVRVLCADAWQGDHPNDYLRLFRDYRRHVKRLYGDVRYVRDERPMSAFQVSGNAECSPDNPYRFNQHPWGSPDTVGWVQVVFQLKDLERYGWRRFMLRKPSGFFCDNETHANFPFQFTSNWQRIADSDPSRAIIATDLWRLECYTHSHPVSYNCHPGTNRAIDLGLWWGRSVEVMDRWPTAKTDDRPVIDPCDPALVGAAFAELDGAAGVNATTIGLDAFSNMPPWDAWHWIRDMQDAYPSFHFLIEPATSDMLHVLAPMFVRAFAATAGAGDPVGSPQAMADFLNPGHETHAGLFSSDDIAPSDYQAVRAAMRDVASWGFVPHVFYDSNGLASHTEGIQVNYAAPTWLTEVPEDLRP